MAKGQNAVIPMESVPAMGTLREPPVLPPRETLRRVPAGGPVRPPSLLPR